MSDNPMRVAKPDLLVEAQINAAGVGLINTFVADLFAFIDKGMSKTDGQDWLVKLQAQDIKSGEVNYRDPSVLLKEIAQSRLLHTPQHRSHFAKNPAVVTTDSSAVIIC